MKNKNEVLEGQESFNLEVGYVNKSIKVTYNQAVNIMEALNNFIQCLKDIHVEGVVQNARTQFKIKESEKLFEYLQNEIGYNFEEKCEKCQKALHKKQSDVGGDAMTLAVNGYNRG